MSDPSSPRPAKPDPSPLVVRVLGWATAAGVILVFPALLIGKFGWLLMTIWGLAIVGLALVGLFNLSGERERWRASWAYRRWDDGVSHWRWPGVYPTFMQTTRYVVAVSFLMLLVGIMFAIFGITQVAR